MEPVKRIRRLLKKNNQRYSWQEDVRDVLVCYSVSSTWKMIDITFDRAIPGLQQPYTWAMRHWKKAFLPKMKARKLRLPDHKLSLSPTTIPGSTFLFGDFTVIASPQMYIRIYLNHAHTREPWATRDSGWISLQTLVSVAADDKIQAKYYMLFQSSLLFT